MHNSSNAGHMTTKIRIQTWLYGKSLCYSRVWIYIVATINHGKPKQILAKGNPTSTITHATPKSSKTNSGTALGFHVVKNDEQCSTGTR